MNRGAIIFVGAFFAMAFSWFGIVLLPQLQIGGMNADSPDNLAKLESRTNWIAAQRGLPIKEGGAGAYPFAPAGLAAQGAGVYRSLGCNYCHSQQIRQTGSDFEVMLNKSGTNAANVIAALRKILPDMTGADTARLLEILPRQVIQTPSKHKADAVKRVLAAAGAQAMVQVVPLGPDIQRGWGRRQSVAQDYLMQQPVMTGSMRVGPDLANVGARLPDAAWQYRHLYAPRSKVKHSTMPPYRFLFTERTLAPGDALSPEGIPLTAAGAFFDRTKDTGSPAAEIIPNADARALVAYLSSLRADGQLFESPLPLPPMESAADATANTNAPAAAGNTNAPAATAP